MKKVTVRKLPYLGVVNMIKIMREKGLISANVLPTQKRK